GGADVARLRRHRHQVADLLGLLHYRLRVLDWHQPRRHADFGNSATGERWLASPGDAVCRGHHRIRVDDWRPLPDHPPWQAVAVFLAHAVPEQPVDLAELQVAARVGLLRYLDVSHGQPAVSLPA